MVPITLTCEPLRLTVVPQVGAGIADFSIRGPAKFFYPLLRRAAPMEQSSSLLGCFTMAPWCNRIAGAGFEFGGRRHALSVTSDDGTAIHGDVRNRPWTILDRSPISARLGFDSRTVDTVNFPFPFLGTVRYELSATSLTVDLEVANPGDFPMPVGCGLHPYFPRRLWSDADICELRAPCAGQYPTVNRIVTGPPAADELSRRLRQWAPVPVQPVDTIFGGFEGLAQFRWPASGVGLDITASANQKQLVVFTPVGPDGTPLPFFAVEPQSMVTDGFNLMHRGMVDTGVAVLGPGQSLRTRTVMTVC